MTDRPPGLDDASSEPGGSASGRAWWHHAVGYAVYLRSFADADGDGIGDLAGVIERLDHLSALGVDLLWLTPFHPSPLADNGYDITDYYGVDPTLGDLETVRRLLDAAHRRSIRVVMDLVPNHTSNQHPWFRAALADPAGPERGYYLWRDPAPDGGPPNNWVSCFGGPAWTLDPGSGQYYLHLFLPEQPDLDWRNPAVADEFDAIIRFWLELGVDGFRIDVAQGLVKDAALRSNPQLAPWDPGQRREQQWAAFEHRYDIAQPETLDVFGRWRRLCDAYGAVLIGETYVLEADRYAAMLRGDGLDLGFWFGTMHAGWDAAALRHALAAPLQHVDDHRVIAWAASSLDEVRVATRLGGGEEGRRRALALATLLFCLPGVPFLYQGEELGLLEGIVAPESRTDPVGADVQQSRDGCRTPMPWAPGPNFGFSTAARTWLPDGGRRAEDTVAAQLGRDGSWLERYRALVALRRATPALRQGPFAWADLGHDALGAFHRGPWTVAANLGTEPVVAPVAGTVAFDSLGLAEVGAQVESITLAPAQAVVVATARASAVEGGPTTPDADRSAA